MITVQTGAGKTVVGMLVVLRTVLAEGRMVDAPAVVTHELDRELETCRGCGSRGRPVSTAWISRRFARREPWVATRQKFEAMCRASPLLEARRC